MEFRVLGPLEVVVEGGPVVIQRRLSRSLLAYLLLHANEPVSAERLVDALWGAAPPRTATASLHNQVSALRKLLGPKLIELEPAGYVLRVDPERFDLARFDRLVGEAQFAKVEDRAGLLRAALGLWRGRPLEDLALEDFAQPEIGQLDERYVAAVEERVDADLQLGAGAELVEELSGLIAEHPLRERLRGQLMLALYRAGRQAEALQAYQEARRMLDEELGLEPSKELRELQQRILRHDPALQTTPAVAGPVESRRRVSVLFCDLVGSTRLATTLDPEAYRVVMSSYLGAASRAIEAHGGVVEKHMGDAVMAVFGAPELHEDDALRAVRAAVDAREAVAALEGRELAVRIAVNTGEVVVSASGLVTGATVNIAAHLEQRAGANGIVLGGETYRLVRDAVRAEAIELGDGLHGWRLDGLVAGLPGVARRFDVALVGRYRELGELRSAFRRAQKAGRCEVITVVGEAGIGKTRLARELAASSPKGTRVLVGGCVAYGAGATYLPLAAIVRQAAAEASVAGIASLLSGADDGEQIALLVAELIGITERVAAPEHAFWAVRRLLETIARRQPLVLVLDDVHWAEPTFLDLIEYLGAWADAPILVICLARPELLETRPGWGGPRSTGAVLELPPLSAEHVGMLVEELAGGALVTSAQEAIVARAGGNPLFAEQLFAFAGESPETALEQAPPTLDVLIASRLERLPRPELELLRRASVIGTGFSGDELRALGPVEDGDLRALARRELIHPLAAERGYRFHHVLVHDVAYRGIAKAQRAELHEQAAAILDRRGGADEIVGYHLEQAAHYQEELGRPDPLLAARAGERLAAAGGRALVRDDTRAAASLLERALELTRPLRLDVHLELEFAAAHAHSSPEKACAIAQAAAERAGEAGDEAGEALARVVAAGHRMHFGEPNVDGLEALAQNALRVLEPRKDHAGLVRVWLILGNIANLRCRYEEMAEAAEQARRHRRLAGQDEQDSNSLARALASGPRPADEALRMLDATLPANPSTQTLQHRAHLLAMLGRFDEAWALLHETSARHAEQTGQDASIKFGEVAELAGDHQAAADYLRTFCDWCEGHGHRGILSTIAPRRGRSLCALGRYDEAEPLAELGRELGDEQDALTQMSWRQVIALVAANRGEHARAEKLAREAVAIGERTDALNWQGDAFCDLAEVLHAAGQTQEAAATLEQALERYEHKRNLALAEQARARLAELRRAAIPAASV